ncbi:MAG: serine/threonine protein kinase [Desulfurococcaceae archaeon]
MAFKLCNENPEMDGDVCFIEQYNHFLEKVLCYPRSSCGEVFYKRLTKLREKGFIYLVETGVKIGNIRVLGKGYSAIVVLACHEKYGLGALKIRRVDSRRDTLQKEALIMLKTRDLRIVPRLYLHDEDFIFRELIPLHRCFHYPAYLRALIDNNMVHELKALLRRTMNDLYNLDKMGVDHTELNRLEKHMYYCVDGEIKVIDWESAKESNKPTNISSFISYLLYRFDHKNLLIDVLSLDLKAVLQALHEYKRTYSAEMYKKVLDAMHVL